MQKCWINFLFLANIFGSIYGSNVYEDFSENVIDENFGCLTSDTIFNDNFELFDTFGDTITVPQETEHEILQSSSNDDKAFEEEWLQFKTRFFCSDEFIFPTESEDIQEDDEQEDQKEGQAKDLIEVQQYIQLDDQQPLDSSVGDGIIDESKEFKCLTEVKLMSKKTRSGCKERLMQIKSNLKYLFSIQNPGKSYCLSQYEISNWPREINLYARYWTVSEVEKIEKAFHSFRFVERSTKYCDEQLIRIRSIKIKAVPNGLNRETAHKILLERFRDETLLHSAPFINWNLLNRQTIPVEYDGIKIDYNSIQYPEIYHNPDVFDNIHFFKPNNTREKRKRDTEVPIDSEDQVASVSRNSERYAISKMLLERYREETGLHSEKSIKWKYLNRASIPKEYDHVEINFESIKYVGIYKNPEIYNNIHFFKASKMSQDSEKYQTGTKNIYES